MLSKSAHRKMQYLHLLSAAVVLLSMPAMVLAQESAADSLSRIETETMLLMAREKQLDVQAKIIARQSEIANRQSESERLARGPVIGNPTIHSIEGIGTRMVATLMMDNGSLIETKAGDVLANGVKVISIRSSEVIILDRNKRKVRLASAAPSQPTFNAAFPPAGINLPPLPSAGAMVAIPR